MREKYIVPVVGQVYTNRNDKDYRCTGNRTYPDDTTMQKCVGLGEHWASMVRLSDGWTIKAHGVHQHEDGTIEWNFSSEGSFQSESQAKYQQCRQKEGVDLSKYFDYLDQLRDSGEINMLGAVPYLQEEFFELIFDRRKAREVLQAWMDSYSAHKSGETS